jgi:glutathione S-transferase
MLIVWGRDNSVNVQKVLWFCEEAGVTYDRRDAGLQFGVVGTPEYRSMNPNGLVPTIDDDGFVMWESNAIVRYLAAKHARGSLWPEDPQQCARADQWMDWSSTTFWPTIRPLFLGLIRTPPEKRDAALLEQQRVATATICRTLDAHLARNAYMAGDQFTIGDVPLGCGLWRWFALDVEKPDAPNLQRWFDRLKERPAFKKIVLHPLT